MNELIRNVDRLFENHLYGEAGRQIYDFLWNEFADWYLEIAKLQIEAGGDRAFYTAHTLVRVLDTCLRLLHPFTPFFTEEAWQYLKQAAQEKGPAFNPRHGEWEEALIIARWPEAQPEEGWETQKIADFALLQEVVRAIRNLRAEKKINPGTLTPAIIAAGDRLPILEDNRQSLISLAKIDPAHCEIVDSISEPPQEAASAVTSGIALYLLLEGLIDTTAETARLQRELEQVNGQIERLEQLLQSPFAQKAPTAVVEKEREKLATYRESAQQLQEQLQNLA
jgi:valyl-tRNA synthetase